MVIDSNNNISSSTGNPRNRVDSAPAESKSRPEAGQGKSAAPASADVSLSSRAQLMSKLASQLSSTPEVDADRVAEIRKAIAEGSYKMNAEHIAERMLDQDGQF